MTSSMNSYWNYRILATEHNGEVFLNIHEVYYENDVPNGCSADPVRVGSETVKGITWSLNKMKEATKKPILWGDERFPNVCDKI